MTIAGLFVLLTGGDTRQIENGGSRHLPAKNASRSISSELGPLSRAGIFSSWAVRLHTRLELALTLVRRLLDQAKALGILWSRSFQRSGICYSPKI